MEGGIIKAQAQSQANGNTKKGSNSNLKMPVVRSTTTNEAGVESTGMRMELEFTTAKRQLSCAECRRLKRRCDRQ